MVAKVDLSARADFNETHIWAPHGPPPPLPPFPLTSESTSLELTFPSSRLISQLTVDFSPRLSYTNLLLTFQ